MKNFIFLGILLSCQQVWAMEYNCKYTQYVDESDVARQTFTGTLVNDQDVFLETNLKQPSQGFAVGTKVSIRLNNQVGFDQHIICLGINNDTFSGEGPVSCMMSPGPFSTEGTTRFALDGRSPALRDSLLLECTFK